MFLLLCFVYTLQHNYVQHVLIWNTDNYAFLDNNNWSIFRVAMFCGLISNSCNNEGKHCVRMLGWMLACLSAWGSSLTWQLAVSCRGSQLFTLAAAWLVGRAWMAICHSTLKVALWLLWCNYGDKIAEFHFVESGTITCFMQLEKKRKSYKHKFLKNYFQPVLWILTWQLHRYSKAFKGNA